MDGCVKPGVFAHTHPPIQNTQAHWKQPLPVRLGLHQRAPDTARNKHRLRSWPSSLRSAGNSLPPGLSALTCAQVPDDHGIVRRE